MLNGADMTDAKSEVYIESGVKPSHVLMTPRIGITKATDKNWRFLDPLSPYISRKMPQLKI
jgi:3-methyladenine DNA glycosylase Mpg